MSFRIDEFKKTPSGTITASDRTRFTSVGFALSVIPPVPPIVSGSQRLRYTVDPFTTTPVEARNVSLTLTWSSSTSRPVLYQIGISFIPRPDETKSRPTDWDSGNTLVDKYIKGVVIEADTLGTSRTVEVWVDGAFNTSLTIPATTKGRKEIFQFSFPQTKGRYFRLTPADQSKWQLYQYQWIFDEEPLELVRWETQELAHGIAEWKSVLYANVTLRSSATVNMQITAYNQSGASVVKNYTIPSTGGVKVKTFVPFEATKGILIKYLLTSSQPFALYREETDVIIMPWAAEQSGVVKPFGNDDLDLTRGLYTASGVAERAGGGGQSGNRGFN